MAVNNSKSTLDNPNGCQLSVFVDGCLLCQTYQCLCVTRQVIFGTNYIQKGREKKGWNGTLRQNDDFFADFMLFLRKSLAIPN